MLDSPNTKVTLLTPRRRKIVCIKNNMPLHWENLCFKKLFYPREHAMLARVYILLCWCCCCCCCCWRMLYSIIANFVMVARQVVYCEFRHHGCKSGTCVQTLERSFNSEYFSQSTTFFTRKILFLAQIFFTASWDPINRKLGTTTFFFAQQNFACARPQIS
jgi:hypothetical protein